VRAWITDWCTHQWTGIATAASPPGMTWTLVGPVQTVGPTNGFGNFLSQQCRSLLVLPRAAKDLGELGVDIRIGVEGILPGTRMAQSGCDLLSNQFVVGDVEAPFGRRRKCRRWHLPDRTVIIR
jgi:hypothetical protein